MLLWDNHVHCAKLINLPVLPPMLLRALPAALAALLTPEVAEDWTRERPSEALEVALDALSLALEAVLDAASVALEVVDWLRMLTLRRANCGLRTRTREAERDMAGR